MTFEHFLDLVDQNYYKNEFEVRYGQTVMSTLYRVNPEKYKEISGGEYDCFYNDGIANKTLDKLKKEWV